MKLSYSLPTPSAKAIAEAVGLLPKRKYQEYGSADNDARDDMMERLTQFQQMALACESQDCLIAFYGIELTEAHDTALNLIYKSTRPWLFGHVIGELLDLINNDMTNGRDTVEAAKTIINGLVEDGGISPEAAEQFIVNVYKQTTEAA